MSMTDPIADCITIVRNGIHSKKASVAMPSSRMRVRLAEILKENGYVRDVKVDAANKAKPVLNIRLKYNKSGVNAIQELRRVSKPGCRVYRDSSNIPVEKNGLGIYILSTTQGVMTNVAAKRAGVGGEVLCAVS